MRPRVVPLVALAVFALTFLGACGGGEGPVLTTQEYAEAIEDAFATLQDDSEKSGEAAEQALEDWFEEVGDRLASTDSEDSWSEEDGKLASELAETLVRALTDSFEGTLEALDDFGDELSSLRPPAHLAGLHDAMTEGIEDFVPEARGMVVDDLKDMDTDIDTQADLVEFWTTLGSILEFDPGSGERLDEACQELQASLEAELETSVAICD